MHTTRRVFIKRSAAATAAIGITSTFPTMKAGILGSNEKLVCGVIGVKGMGFANLKAFLDQPNTECGVLCDVAWR
ncbi:MAG: twin-arginine translocation signal domain-containing protein [Bacteroidales bacterium]|nr:twin-arginine translocation signal domain-containing protein [Bacteroidales bacterium]